MLNRVLNWIWYSNSFVGILLYPLSLLFRLIIFFRKLYFLHIINKPNFPNTPIVIIGNLTLGGTGKTSFIIWLANTLSKSNIKVGIISRGYKGSYSGNPTNVNSKSNPFVVGDEAVMISKKTNCRVVVAHNRVDAAKYIINDDIDILLSDDGLQHYAMKRDFEFIMIDGKRGLGNGMCLPAGPLREPASRIKKANSVIINEGDFTYSNAIKTTMKVDGVRQIEGTTIKQIEDFSRTTVHAVAGIGNPSSFFDLLRDYSINVIEHPLPDHANITSNDLLFDDNFPVFITDKDAIKYNFSISKNIWVVEVFLNFKENDTRYIINSIMELI
jgi:tetraacyldisaccharide 4'-kinase|tara:strand:- start:24656 stop:25639 length:984 start_codon:yes stop_codon:yes gene_type:complete